MDSLSGHSAVSFNNLDSRFVKLSAIDMIAQAILERLYLVSGLSQFAPRDNIPMYPDPHRTMPGYFSILVPRNSLQGYGREWKKETHCGSGLGSWDTLVTVRLS